MSDSPGRWQNVKDADIKVGKPIDECAYLGSLAAAEVISHVGPRPLVELRTLVG